VFEAGREMIFGKKQYSSRYEIGGFMVVDLEMDNSPEIIVVSRNLYMFPTQLAVLDSKGHLLREYWHSGRILDFTFYDLDHDEEKEIILSGCNNEYDKGFLAVLEPDFKSGGSPQTGYYKSPNLKQNVEKYYILIPNTIVDKNEYKRGNVIKIHISDERIIYAETKSGLCFEFGFNFELKEIRFADRYEDMYNKAYREGIAKEKFSVKTMDELKTNLMTQVLYYTDEYWSQAPLLARNQVPD